MILSLLDTPTKFFLPDSIVGWVGLGMYCLLFLICLARWWEFPLAIIKNRWQLLVFLFFSIIPANLFLGIGDLSVQNVVISKGQIPGMVFSAVPWFLVSLFFGPILGGLAGLISGLIQTALSTYSLFTPFILGISAMVMGACYRQNYRGGIYTFIRRPIGAAVATILILYLLVSGAAFFDASESVARMVNAGLTTWKTALFFTVIPLLVAGLIGEGLQNQKKGPWRKVSTLLPSPEEGFAESKFWRISLPIVGLFIFFFAQISWDIQTRQINGILKNGISSHAGLTAQYWPQEAKNLFTRVKAIAIPETLTQGPSEFSTTMLKTFADVKTRIVVVNQKSQVIQQFPEDATQHAFSTGVLTALKLSLLENVPRLVSSHTGTSDHFLTISIIQPIQDTDGQQLGILIVEQGEKPRLGESLFWSEVDRIEEAGGQIWVIRADEKTPMLDDIPAPDLQSQVFAGRFLTLEGWRDTASYAFWNSSDEWDIYVKIPPTAAAENILLDFLKQMMFLVLVCAFLMILLSQYWTSLFRDEQRLLQASRQISRGNYQANPGLQEVTELTDIASAVEQIRVNVKAQIDEAQRLISIGRGVAVREDFGTSIEPILNAALRGDASCARVILIPPRVESVVQAPLRRFGRGERNDAYAVLDDQVLEICKREGIFVIRNTARSRRIDFNNAVTVPASIIGLPIYLEKDDFLGVFWIGYEKQQVFPDEEIAHLKALTSEIAVAAAGERRLSETELGRKQFEALVSSIQDPLMLLDMSGEVIFANDAALSMEGLIVRDENDRRVAALPAMQKVISGSPLDIDREGMIREVQFADGKIYSARFTPFQTDGKFGGSLCLLRDVNSYAEMLSHKGEFVETVSHDLRQPLTMISGYATMIQMVGELNEQQRSYLQKITGGLDTLNRMVNNILDLGRIETGTRLRLEKVDIGDLVNSVVEEFGPRAEQRKINLSNTTQLVEPLILEADNELMRQAVYNILDNAIKFTGINGKVRVWVENQASKCVIFIQDTGIGISPIDLPGIFDRTVRSNIHEAGQRTSKLGLTIVKSIVELHGGKVLVESQLGKGSTFRIEIPY